MKVLIYSHAFAPMVGGVETYVMLLAEGLAERAVRVTLVTPTPAGDMDDAKLPFRVVRQPSTLEVWHRLRGADIVHLAGPCLQPMLLGLALRKRIVVEHHGYQAVCPNGLLLYEPANAVCPGHFMAHHYHKCLQCEATSLGWMRSVFELLLSFPRRWACKRVALNLPISHHVRQRVRLPRSRVVYYGIPDLQRDTPLAGGQRAEPGCCSPTFAYVGRLVKEKGLPVLLQAARQLKSAGSRFRLKIIGDGPERANLTESGLSLGIESEVAFTGGLQGGALQAALKDVSVVVMPTVMEETAGLAAIEQMMRGKIVIVSDIGGLGEVVDDAGLKFAPGDAAGLASCLRRVLDDPSLVEVLGSKARERALRYFLQERMIAEHLALYRQLLGELSPLPVLVSEEG
jgi:glycosyltransferase involved in cell wall biosynthesis